MLDAVFWQHKVCVPPAPPTSILMVPLGPRLVFITSNRPLAALMFMNNAALRPRISALGLSCFTDPITLCQACKEIDVNVASNNSLDL